MCYVTVFLFYDCVFLCAMFFVFCIAVLETNKDIYNIKGKENGKNLYICNIVIVNISSGNLILEYSESTAWLTICICHRALLWPIEKYNVIKMHFLYIHVCMYDVRV